MQVKILAYIVVTVKKEIYPVNSESQGIAKLQKKNVFNVPNIKEKHKEDDLEGYQLFCMKSNLLFLPW